MKLPPLPVHTSSPGPSGGKFMSCPSLELFGLTEATSNSNFAAAGPAVALVVPVAAAGACAHPATRHQRAQNRRPDPVCID